MCLKETTDRTALFPTKKTGTTSPDPSSKQGAVQNGDGKMPHEVCEKQQKKGVPVGHGKGSKTWSNKVFLWEFCSHISTPTTFGSSGFRQVWWWKWKIVSERSFNQIPWFLKVYHLEHLEPTFLIYFWVLCPMWLCLRLPPGGPEAIRGSQRNWGERIPLPNFWKNIQVEPALSSTGRNHLNFTVVDPCCARSHSCTLGCTRCVRMMMGFLPSRNLTKMMILQQCWWGFRMIWFFWVHMCFTWSHC